MNKEKQTLKNAISQHDLQNDVLIEDEQMNFIFRSLILLKKGLIKVESVYDFINTVIEYRTLQEKQNHENEMKQFAEWLDGAPFYMKGDLWISDECGFYTTHELLNYYKNNK